MFCIFYFAYNTDHKWCFVMWMEECDHFDIVHCIFLFLFYYCLILYRKRKNQIYFYLIYDFTTDY
ncbi:hypothetical protein ECC69_03930 [Salmonella enterica subsp. enterica]|uniref:Uncharacterized protein n=1 Tax=Salmonella enteritidis TaxID=149539 RepID=A0A5X4UXE9_SALEN|nr:hypothetical protein [Salmonella enterica subsp. enterica serovar Enteritidis]EAB8085320.1 hypothetical protein [Salmonella enterica subsp. arizonae]EAB7908316.1 hypothetical protein [Salmonella enterica subsp. enterica serovar Enteritidis]EAC1135461.1 hypothetical protein [Salmonella enterica subsp. enterica serovar Enteritidis]EBQ9618719.1 hypothetical protein [Salmonella enterica subsp. enterica serovar Enteritidis]